MIGMIVVFFRVCNRRFGIFLGVYVQAKSFKKIKLVFLGYKNISLEYASLINSELLVFFRFIFDQEVYFRVRKFYGLVVFRVVFLDFRRSSGTHWQQEPGVEWPGNWHELDDFKNKMAPMVDRAKENRKKQ